MEIKDGILSTTNCKKCDHCVGKEKKNCRKECGCNKCKKNCNYPLPEEVMDLVFKIENFVFYGGEAMGQFICSGYPKVNLSYNKKIRVYKDILLEMYQGLVAEDSNLVYSHCVCPDQFPRIKSDVVSIIGTQQIELENETFDNTGLDQWLLENPKQITFDRWKKVFYDLDIVPQFTVTPMPDCALRFVYDVAVMEKPEIKTVVTAIKKASPRLELKSWAAKIEKCDLKIEYSSFVKSKNCSIKYNAYVSALKCGFTPIVIENLYKCGFTIKASTDKNTCIVCSNSSAEMVCNKENFSVIINTINKCNIL